MLLSRLPRKRQREIQGERCQKERKRGNLKLNRKTAEDFVLI